MLLLCPARERIGNAVAVRTSTSHAVVAVCQRIADCGKSAATFPAHPMAEQIVFYHSTLAADLAITIAGNTVT